MIGVALLVTKTLALVDGLQIAVAKGAVLAFNVVLLANPIGLVVAATCVALVGGIVILYRRWQPFRDFMNKYVADPLIRLVGFINDKVLPALRAVGDAVRGAVSAVSNAIGAVSGFGRIPGFAEGGIVPATPGGRIIRVAEGGRDEAIVPLGPGGGGMGNGKRRRRQLL